MTSSRFIIGAETTADYKASTRIKKSCIRAYIKEGKIKAIREAAVSRGSTIL